jgi:tetratricopeptide (TPR) repeat protein/serine/threonine protein kinase
MRASGDALPETGVGPAGPPAPTPDDPRVVRALEEYSAALKAGRRPDRREFLARYAEVAGPLAECLDGLEFVCAAVPDVPRPAPGLPAGPGPDPDVRPALPLGDYRLLREVGRGGMGVVYEAEQLSLGRRVALKVLPFAAALDPRRLQRFKNEAHAAAQLRHPGIVSVHSVGCERGVHFYAMEYVEGQSLAAVIRDLRQLAGREGAEDLPAPAARPAGGERTPEHPARSAGDSCPTTPYTPSPAPAPGEGAGTDAGTWPGALPSTERTLWSASFFRSVAGLGVQAAEALEHAHQMGVVHRDVKPANLLVDGRGHLWVTDFGLAQVQSDARLTMTGDLLGTLRYMSPEQALAQRVIVDHRTDIYSLGATLYELLTLEPAFGGRDRQEVLRQIAFEEPRPPRRLNKAVPAELETIVLKAMAKNPDERYAFAQELADDLGRYLKDEPIRARRPSLLQRTRKWARRHRAVVWAAGVCLLVAVVALAGVVGWRLRERAERRARTAEAVEAALKDSDEHQRASRVPEALEAGRRAASALAAGEGSPGLRRRVRERQRDLEMLAKVESVRLRKGQMRQSWRGDAVFRTWESSSPPRFDKSTPVNLDVRVDEELTEAFKEYGVPVEQLDPEEAGRQIRERSIAVELAAALDDWATWRRGTRPRKDTGWKHLLAVARAADPDRWRTRLRDALEKNDRGALEKLAGQDASLSVPVVSQLLLAEGLVNLGARDRAVTFLRKAQRKHPGEFFLNLLLAGNLLRPGRKEGAEEAVRFYTAALAARPRTAPVQAGLAGALRVKGDLDESIAAYRAAIDLDPDLFIAHVNLAAVLDDKGLHDQAVAAYERASRIRPGDSTPYCNLGAALAKRKKLDEAVAALKRAISLREDDASAHYNLGQALREKKLPAEAVGALRKALRLRPGDFLTLMALAEALHEKGSRDEALTAFRDSARLRPDLADAHASLGDELSARGQPEEAIGAYRRALRLRPDYAQAHHNLGLALVATGRIDEAIIHYREAVRLKPRSSGFHVSLGAVLCDHKRDHKGAIAAFREAIRLKRDDPLAHENLGIALSAVGDFDRAIAAFGEAVRLKGDNAGTYWMLGNAFAARRRYDDAINAYRQAIRRGPDLFEAHFGLGRALLDKGAPRDAVGPFEKAVELKPDHAWSHSHLGDVLREAGRPDEAMEAYGKALKLWRKLAAGSPGVPAYQSQLGATLNNLAIELNGRKDFAQAARLLEEAVARQKAALDIDPRNPRYRLCLRNHYWNLAEALLGRAEHGKAARVAAELPGLYPDAWQDSVRAAGYLYRCAALAAKDTALPGDRRKELVEAYGHQAVALLRRALDRGWEDVTAVKAPVFEPLRGRDDFQKLLATRERKGKP